MPNIIERVAARDAVLQVLADAGYNRETITQMLEEVINDKVEKRLEHIMQTRINDIEKRVSDRYDRAFNNAMTDYIRRAFPYTKVSIELVNREINTGVH